MDYYTATVRPGGQLTHSVPKAGLTSNEIRFLRSLHGGADAVIDIAKMDADAVKKAGYDVSVTAHDDHLRLAAIYGRKKVEKFFGVMLDDFSDGIEEDATDEFDEPMPPGVPRKLAPMSLTNGPE